MSFYENVKANQEPSQVQDLCFDNLKPACFEAYTADLFCPDSKDGMEEMALQALRAICDASTPMASFLTVFAVAAVYEAV